MYNLLYNNCKTNSIEIFEIQSHDFSRKFSADILSSDRSTIRPTRIIFRKKSFNFNVATIIWYDNVCSTNIYGTINSSFIENISSTWNRSSDVILLTYKKKKKNVIDYFQVDRTRATNDSFVQGPTFFSDDDSDDGVLSFKQRGRCGSEIFVSISNGSLTGWIFFWKNNTRTYVHVCIYIHIYIYVDLRWKGR